MLRIFLDTDVAFDIISKRQPHYNNSIVLLEKAVDGELKLVISESCLANLTYLVLEINKVRDGLEKLTYLLEFCDIAGAGKARVREALLSDFNDKEDAIQYYTALGCEVDYFITRNIKDYKKAKGGLPVLLPVNFLKGL